MLDKKAKVKPFHSYEDLTIPPPLSQALKGMGFIKPTPIQAMAIPPGLEGKDILGTAQTGTGKTAAFAVPLLARLYVEPAKQGLILVPTRELAAQVHQVMRQMGKGLGLYGSLVVGGESFRRQADELDHRADYIIATPGRLNDHLEEGTADLSHIGFLVLDEVDRMFDMGFAPQVKRVLAHVPNTRQTLLFSATLPSEIVGLASKLLVDPVRAKVGVESQTVPEVTESTIRTTNDGKNKVILAETKTRQGKILVFTRTQNRTERLARLLYNEGHSVVSLHGGRSQGQRKQALERFRAGTHRIMVATDLAGRGIDVNDIEHVINYDLPASREDYIHRVGRTARFGKKGNAVNLLVQGDRDGERVLAGKSPSTPAPQFRPRPTGQRPGRRGFQRSFR